MSLDLNCLKQISMFQCLCTFLWSQLKMKHVSKLVSCTCHNIKYFFSSRWSVYISKTFFFLILKWKFKTTRKHLKYKKNLYFSLRYNCEHKWEIFTCSQTLSRNLWTKFNLIFTRLENFIFCMHNKIIKYTGETKIFCKTVWKYLSTYFKTQECKM